MGYLPPLTIAETLRSIQKGELILPAIQREYVWRPKQIIALFDSIMRGYPIGGFLSWRVEPATVDQFRFYGFMRDFNEFSNRHNPTLDLAPGQAVRAVLDGQQRLTSLNVGLRGSYAFKNARAWSNNPDNYPTRRLYLNVMTEAGDNEAGLRYDFRFLTDANVKEAAAAEDPTRVWFPVSKVFETDDLGDLWDLAGEAGLANTKSARSMLSQLWKAVHSTQSLYFYEEAEQDVERVLDIFIRVNSGGTVLSYSDLLLSIATAQWKERDARAAIHGLVDTLNTTGGGFSFSRDVVLKSGLVLAGVNDIGFQVKNFTADNMARLDEQWDAISDSLKVAAGLLSDFGLSGATLSANSVLIPVAYYIHRRRLTQSYRTAPAEASDRAAVKSWVLRSLIMRGIWGSGLDSLLRDLRQAILDHGATAFPVAEIERRMAARGKSLLFGPEQIEDILALAYGGARTFAVLATLFPHVNTRNVHHVDHVFPQALLSRGALKDAGIARDDIENLIGAKDLLPNLQLLEGPENISKSDRSPAAWAAETFDSQDALEAYKARNALPWLPASATDFAQFAEERRTMLRGLLERTLNAGHEAEVAAPASATTAEMSIEDELAEAAFDEQ
ncbi:DUF262 domain-containing protein [Microbacter sp. GSS18]|nr:DUF262 domain-containing protein [Microbacter sp. GSS18]